MDHTCSGVLMYDYRAAEIGKRVVLDCHPILAADTIVKTLITDTPVIICTVKKTFHSSHGCYLV